MCHSSSGSIQAETETGEKKAPTFGDRFLVSEHSLKHLGREGEREGERQRERE